jgi:hypothetical protein
VTRQSSGACAGEGPRNANPVYPMREAAVTEQRDGLASTPPFGKPPVRNLAISGVALADLSIMSMVNRRHRHEHPQQAMQQFQRDVHQQAD